MNTQQMDETIWNYIDGTAKADEIAFTEQMIANDAIWRSKYHELKEVNQLLQTELELEQPSLRFSKNVMEQLHGLKPAPATNQYINKSIIRGIAVFFIVSIISFLIYGFTLIDWSTSSTTSNTSNYKLPAVDYSALFSSTWINAILMIAVVMGLMLMDGYLRRNRKAA